MFPGRGPFCQSCGMPLSRDDQGGGTNGDGSASRDYCSHCYQDGRFTEPNLSVEEMMARVEEKLLSMHVPSFLARRLTRNIPKLSRWHTAPAGQAGAY